MCLNNVQIVVCQYVKCACRLWKVFEFAFFEQFKAIPPLFVIILIHINCYLTQKLITLSRKKEKFEEMTNNSTNSFKTEALYTIIHFYAFNMYVRMESRTRKIQFACNMLFQWQYFLYFTGKYNENQWKSYWTTLFQMLYEWLLSELLFLKMKTSR